ncbi:hypothetical protein [Streptococcus thoraltensis]|uniref:hypothetical protein n=1 Tax=Streptococcus thoraltensis TaxID=55085 RepID=UPI001F598A07|nr:hypothetical protein [Streptococcus thoraltensis]
MKKKVLRLGFVILSLLFISACSNNSSKQVSNELEGKYYATINDYDHELYHLSEIVIDGNTLTYGYEDEDEKIVYSIDAEKKTLIGDGKVHAYTYEDGKLTTDISGNTNEYFQKGSKAYKEFLE